jgi:hypothetical protein
MIAPVINIFRSKEEAFYFRNSQINRFYVFTGVQLLPNNQTPYVQITDTPDGLNVEDWTVNAVTLYKGVKTDITLYFNVDSLTNSTNGNPQLFWSLTNVPFDFGSDLIYLEITQVFGETFYTQPFLLTDYEKEKTTQFHYKDKRKDLYQSIGFKSWFRQSDKKTKLTSYYEASTRNTVTQAVETNKIERHVSEVMNIETLTQLTDVLESPYLYVNKIRCSLFEAITIPELTQQENFTNITFILSPNKSDIFSGDYVEPLIVTTPDYSPIDYLATDYKTT